MPEIIKKLEQEQKPLNTFTVLGAIEYLVERCWALLRWLAFVSVILFITMFGIVLVVTKRNHTIDNTANSADQARQAAVDAKEAVNNAVKLTQEGVRVDPAAIIAALDAVHRIEDHICGGPCPDPNK